MRLVALGAQSWNGTRIPASFGVEADGVAVSVATFPVDHAQLPDAAVRLVITATPTGPEFFATTVAVQVGPDGVLFAEQADAAAALLTTVQLVGISVSRVDVTVSRVRDASAAACAQLAQPPSTRAGEPNSVAELTVQGDFPPPTWALPDRPGLHLVDAAAPVANGLVGTRIVDCTGSDTDLMVLEVAGVRVPKLIAVGWPRTLLRDDGAAPTPFLVYYHSGMGQNVDDGYYVGGGLAPYPYNFDFCYYGLYAYLWYVTDPLVGDPYAKGLPFQVGAGGKDVVTVLPCNAPVGTEPGVFSDAASVETLLLEIQAYAFRRAGVTAPPASLGRTALAAFSSGNHFLAGFLGLAKNRAHHFLTDVVAEAYLFEPPGYVTDALVASALGWAGDPSTGRRVALYSQELAKAHAKLLGGTPPSGPFVANPSPERTAAALPAGGWRRTAEAAAGVKRPWWGFQETHQVISAMMLTHAIATSGF